ncbi:Vacuolar protein sorting-associated protein 62 [Phlyctochytrium planicorne]|nr:Vacuolar protein sorting-associated protein 62 [Phlyctochytrium planicorne]
MLFSSIKNLILLTSLAASSALALVAAPSPNLTARDAPVSPELQQLVQKYAPLIRFHPDEKAYVTSVDYFLSHPRVYLRDEAGNRPANTPALSTSNLDFLQKQGQDDSSKYLWVDGNVVADPDLPAENQFLYGNRDVTGVPIYAFIVPKANGVTDIYYIGKSSPLGIVDDHVGDWERFIVRTQNGQAIALDYYTHGGQGVRVVPANDPRVQWVGTHPVVYSAQGSHGSWPQAGSNVYVTVAGLYDLTDETADGGSQWRTWENVKPVIYKPNGGYTDDLAFLNFRGRYGNKGDESCWFFQYTKACALATGPQGPNRNFSGYLGQVLASNGGDNSRITFSIDQDLANRAAAQNLPYIAIHIHCPGTPIFGDNGDVERWGVVPFQQSQLQYTITTDRCRKGRDRYVKNYEIAFCTANDQNACTRKSGGERALKVLENGSEVKKLGVNANDLDPWWFNL